VLHFEVLFGQVGQILRLHASAIPPASERRKSWVADHDCSPRRVVPRNALLSTAKWKGPLRRWFCHGHGDHLFAIDGTIYRVLSVCSDRLKGESRRPLAASNIFQYPF
jgi:hypothetical protein